MPQDSSLKDSSLNIAIAEINLQHTGNVDTGQNSFWFSNWSWREIINQLAKVTVYFQNCKISYLVQRDLEKSTICSNTKKCVIPLSLFFYLPYPWIRYNIFCIITSKPVKTSFVRIREFYTSVSDCFLILMTTVWVKVGGEAAYCRNKSLKTARWFSKQAMPFQKTMQFMFLNLFAHH